MVVCSVAYIDRSEKHGFYISTTKNILVIAGLSVVLGLASCQQEGVAEKAWKNLYRSIENAE